MRLFVWCGFVSANCQRSGLVYRGNGPPTLGGIWIAKNSATHCSKTVTANQVLFSLILFALVYALLLILFLYLLNRKIHHGPETGAHDDDEEQEAIPNAITQSLTSLKYSDEHIMQTGMFLGFI